MPVESVGSLRNSVAVAARSLRYAGLDAVREVLNRNLHSYVGSLSPDPVLDADWEVLVVLDACRADVFKEVIDEGHYEHVPAGEVKISPASSSQEWLTEVFRNAPDTALMDLAYVTGNPYASELDAARFAYIDHVWRDGWDDELGTIPPSPITDRAIARWRQEDLQRMVVHYMQPHFPSLASDIDDGIALDTFGEASLSVWNDLRYSHLDIDAAWAAYRGNLEIVLEEVESLVNNLAADRVVITADHGNAFGEKHIWGHPSGVHLPCLREVPWSVTSGVDRETRSASIPATSAKQPDNATVEDRLTQLGYTS